MLTKADTRYVSKKCEVCCEACVVVCCREWRVCVVGFVVEVWLLLS